jgi:hypothetical protein
MLIPVEAAAKFLPVIRRHDLPRLENLDSVALLLLPKPHYPYECLRGTAIGKRPGLDYPSPGKPRARFQRRVE